MKKPSPQTGKNVAPKPKTAPGPQPATAAAGAPTQDGQRAAFEKAIARFRSGDFASAARLFEEASRGPQLEIGHAARMHRKMCERRLPATPPAPSNPEDLYALGVTLLNQRDLGGAEQHLRRALALTPNGDHIHYALAATYALRGDVAQAYENLKRAIELQPLNRRQARTDPDFAGVIHQSPVSTLLRPAKGPGG